jgi:hypothetical protein
MHPFRRSHARFALVLKWFGAMIGVLVVSPACRGKQRSVDRAPGMSSAHVYGLSPNEPVAAECKRYAENVVRCVADPHFPSDTKQAQISALVQMMDRMKFADVPAADRGEAIAGAAEECRAALSTLELSSKVACPGAL